MAVAILLDENTGAYFVAMSNSVAGSASYLVDERGYPIDVSWEGGHRGFGGVHAIEAIAATQRRFERVDAVFREMMR